MPVMRIVLDGNQSWPDLKDNPNVIDAMGEGSQVSVTALAGGMKSGNTSVTFRIDCPDGQIVLFETSLALLKAAVGAFVAKYGEPTEHPRVQERGNQRED